MKIEDFRTLVHAQPFRPFTIHYRTGQRYRIRKSEDAWAPAVARDSKIFVNDHRGSFAIIDSTWIERVTLGRNGGTSRRRKAG